MALLCKGFLALDIFESQIYLLILLIFRSICLMGRVRARVSYVYRVGQSVFRILLTDKRFTFTILHALHRGVQHFDESVFDSLKVKVWRGSAARLEIL